MQSSPTFPSPNHHPPRVPHRRSILLPLAALCFLSALALLLLYAFVRRRIRLRSRESSSDLADLARSERAPVFPYDLLRSATNNFDPNRLIGSGGFGSVFLARLHNSPSSPPLAVKRLHSHRGSVSTKSFVNEVLLLSSLRHPHLLRLHGYCPDPRSLLLVYDYAPNSTLSLHLHSSHPHPFPFPLRLAIASQIASALSYLHSARIVHRDVTSSNVFLDRDMRAKLGDFGLSRLLQDSSSPQYTGPQGTPGYLDPDYHRSFRLTEKSDIYSFGVVMLELVTGMRAVDMGREKGEVSLAEMAVGRIQRGKLREMVDPVVVGEGEEGMGAVEAVTELAFRCVAEEKDDRPDAREVLEELRRIKGSMSRSVQSTLVSIAFSG